MTDSRGVAFRDEILNYLAVLEGKFTSVWTADHFIPWHDQVDKMTDTLECWTGLTYLAGKFEIYDFGSLVLCQSYRNLALLAKMAVTFQLMSGGRLILGIGAGWKEDEYLAYGYDFPPTSTRVHQMGEVVQIIKQMWTDPQTTFHGNHYQVDDAICQPKPGLLPPIMIGGGGKNLTLHYVAQYADWWNFPGGTPQRYAELLKTLRMHCQKVGRDYNEITKTWVNQCVAVADTHTAALEIARHSPLYDPDSSIIRSVAEVENQIRRFSDLGVEYFIFRFADFPKTDMAERFASEVEPKFKSAVSY